MTESQQLTAVKADTSQPGRMSFLDRFLGVWILLAMACGLALGRSIPGLGEFLGAMEIGGISIPIAVGLLVMMFLPLAKVRIDKTWVIDAGKLMIAVYLLLYWFVVHVVYIALL